MYTSHLITFWHLTCFPPRKLPSCPRLTNTGDTSVIVSPWYLCSCLVRRWSTQSPLLLAVDSFITNDELHLVIWPQVHRLSQCWDLQILYKTSNEPYVTSGCWEVGNARVPTLLCSITVRTLPWTSVWILEGPEESPCSSSVTFISPWPMS